MSEQETIVRHMPASVSLHRYERLVIKEFKATIPIHILAKLPEDERYVVESMSKMENQYEWLKFVAIRLSEDVVELAARVSTTETALEVALRDLQEERALTKGMKEKVDKLWDWKQFFSGKWAVVASVGIVLLSVLLKVGVDLVVKLFKP